MATIRKMQNKNGISYQVQVKLKDIISNKPIIKCMTWHPKDKMTQKQIEREVVVVADEFEKKVKSTLNGSMNGSNEINMTLKEYYEKWLERRKGDLALNTYVHYKETLKLLDRYIGGVKLKDLTPFIIQKFYDELDSLKKTKGYAVAKPKLKTIIEKNGISRRELAMKANLTHNCINSSINGQRISIKSAEKIAKVLDTNINTIYKIQIREEPYAYETIHKHKRNLRAVLATAKKQRIIGDNYASADYITFGKRPENKINFMDDEESKIFYKALMEFDDIKIKTAMLTLLYTGIRRGELAGLNWNDIDFEKDTIDISRSYVPTKGYGVNLKNPKTTSSNRLIAIPRTLSIQLQEYKDWQHNESIKYGDRWVKSNAIFTNDFGERIYPQTINKWLDRVLEKSNLRHFNIHSLRHTNITLQIMAGVPLSIVSARAGHARTSTTSDIYTHFVKSVDREAAEKLNEMFQ